MLARSSVATDEFRTFLLTMHLRGGGGCTRDAATAALPRIDECREICVLRRYRFVPIVTPG
jgi:hypothetical protein